MKSRYIPWLVMMVASAALLLLACSNVGSNSPEKTLQAFFSAANSGRYSEAEGYLTSSAKSIMVLAGGIKKFADEETRSGTLTTVEILRTEKRGEGAKIYYRIHYQNGQTKDDDATLIIENGRWRIAG